MLGGSQVVLNFVSYESDMKQFNRWRPPKKFALVLFAALVVIAIAALPPYLRAKRSERWPTAEGVISANWLKVIYNARNRTDFCHAEIEYRYHVGTKEYSSTKVSFGRDRYRSQPEAQHMLDRYPMRSAVKVYYDPADPSFGILQPGRNDEMELLYKMELWFIGIFGFLFTATLLWYDEQPRFPRPSDS